ncbi:hypothetical protein CY34DRAFT_804413 [Suillus luteus UH-Slu-Lm8-n1]|uniref:Uncharacterized protein n=1 Tax=Suillus luteus UH-Slu-Lm8-n1 TaxID=930992 RepID=A0A0D0AM43_9AGAM|nr:hypothetical protein CY34DRAFT_804413 [Suillus luteus UH-Slu-Lm8-n1]
MITPNTVLGGPASQVVGPAITILDVQGSAQSSGLRRVLVRCENSDFERLSAVNSHDLVQSNPYT